MSVTTMAHCQPCGLYFGATHSDVASGLCGACGGALTMPQIVSTIDVMYAREPVILLDAEGRVIDSPDVRERLDSLAAELRWCDAERRLALRALAEYAPACDECVREVMARIRLDRDMRLATNELRGLVYCDEHLHADRPLVYAAQIAAADEEMRK